MTATATTAAAATSVSARDRTDRRLRIAIAVICVIGIGVATYLTYTHYAGLNVVCPVSGGCETVQKSVYSKLDGIPVAVLGLAGYITILFSLAIRNEFGRVAGFGLALVGCLFSLYLTYREIFTIKAICPWCVSSAVMMTLLTILTGIRVLRAESSPPAPTSRTVPRAERRRIERKQAARH
jgi:uncharacterized membrane protein